MGQDQSKTEEFGSADTFPPAELLPYPYQVLAPDGSIQFVNEAWLTTVSTDRAAALGTEFTQYLTAESATAFESTLQSLREGPPPEEDGHTLEVVVTADDRRTVNVALRGEYESSELVRVHCQFADTIVSGTRLGADQTRSFPQLKRAVEAAGHAVFITDTEGVIEYVNPAFEEITGYAAAEAIGQNPRILKSGEMSPAFYEQLWTKILNGEVWQQELCNRRKDGELFYAHQTIAPVTSDDGTVEAFVAIQADISEQKRQRDRLQRSQERIRALFDKSPDSITVHDEEGNILDVNDQTVEDLGYTRDELSSMHIVDIEVGISKQKLQEMWQRMEPGDRETVEGRHRRKDGSTFPVDVWLNRLEFNGEEQFIALSRDITERKRRERKLESQRDDLEVLNQMMRHDIRNDLQLVQLHAELLSDHVGPDAERYLDSLLESVGNAVSLTETARELAEVMLGAEDTEQRVSLALTLDQKLSELRSSYDTADIEVVGSVPPVEVIGTDMLGSVFRNILQNAIQHNTVSDPRVAICCEETDDAVIVSIVDNGPGVPDDQKEEIFGKGEKGLGSDGTGIGLYLVHTLVESYGGEVWVEDGENFDGLAHTDVAADDFDGAVFRVQLRKAN